MINLFIIIAGLCWQTATIETSCTTCNANETVYFTGSGYTPGKIIDVHTKKDGVAWINFYGGTVDANGEIAFEIDPSAGFYEFDIYEVKKKSSILMAQTSITVN